MPGWVLFVTGVLTLAGIYGALAMALNLEAGWAGLWDLGTAGLFAVGGYSFVILTAEIPEVSFAPELPMMAGVVAAGLITAVVAAMIGLPSLRLRGEYFMITTFAFAEVIRHLITNEGEITRGSSGISGLERPFDDLVSGRDYNFVLLGIVVVAVIAVYLVLRQTAKSPFGRALRALRDNEAAALALGKNVTRQRLKAFVLAGLIIGMIAPIYVWYIRSIFPHLYVSDITFVTWTALVVGGIGSLRGPLLGALILMSVTEATHFLQVDADKATLIASFHPIIIGVALIAILRFRPEGLLPARRDYPVARPTGLGGAEPPGPPRTLVPQGDAAGGGH
ncbi:MAG: branched-chain amino acid transport system permease protein [Thermoleophilaceae bacterium]|jgi:branched-chain amino acid transport system permease protein|nr:branched-chain amino acid transport system permease protein [Thermoleophilaceae bacterium]MEA2400709.1 branched-chain amino acid transport system permease protein [Thermoleophilaceae bacterium]